MVNQVKSLQRQFIKDCYNKLTDEEISIAYNHLYNKDTTKWSISKMRMRDLLHKNKLLKINP